MAVNALMGRIVDLESQAHEHEEQPSIPYVVKER